MCFLCQSLDPSTTQYDTHGLVDMSTVTPAAEDGTGSALPVYTLDQVAYQLTDGYWQSSNREWRAFDVQYGDTLTVNISGLDAMGQQTALDALDAWTAVSGLQFQTTTGSADITFDDDDSGAYAYSYIYTDWNEIASSHVNVHTSWQGSPDYYYQTYIHEIGHALGLGHGGNYNGSADFASQAHYANDSWQMSIMSYFGQWENPNVDASANYLATAQMADILAIHNLYGTPDNVNTGDTVYGDNTNLSLRGMDLSRDYAVTIFDSTGTDVIDLGSRWYSQSLSLLPESWSNLNGEIGNFAIARGAVIENAITGTGDDLVQGNTANNHIQTSAGADTLIGGAGDDTLDGGDGTDIAVFDGAPGEFLVTYDDGLIVTDMDLADGFDQGSDMLIGIEMLTFTDGYGGEVETDGALTTIRFYADGSALTSSLVEIDVANMYDWTSITRSFSGGLWDFQINTYDDGRLLQTDFTEGQRSSATMTDIGDVHAWSSYTTRYDADGLRLSHETVRDDGMVVLNSYADGARTNVLTTDGGNAFAWTSINRSFDTSGTLTQQVNSFDNGSVQEITFVEGQRSAISMTDGSGTAAWDSYTDSYDANGLRVSREMIYDDGRIVALTYEDGQVVSNTVTDGADAFVWTSVTRTWDAEGSLDSQTNLHDDGSVLEIDYIDGIRSAALLSDVADVYAWDTNLDTYDADGALVERVLTWDDGTQEVTLYGGDAVLG